MRLPLLIGANPLNSVPGHISVVPPGRWRIVSDGVIDTLLSFKSPRGSLSIGDEIHTDVNLCFTVEFLHRGTERQLSVFAERLAT